MRWFRKRRDEGRGGSRDADRAALDHLEQFVRSRYGVEAFVEPRTTVTETTVLLVAHDGEWTRRRVAGPDAAAKFAARLSIPVYDVNLVGYPQRMRAFNERRKREQQPPAERS